MKYVILMSWLLCMPVHAETKSLDFQNYPDYIYPEEKSGKFLEQPLSSTWIKNRTEEIKQDNKLNKE